MSFQPKHILAAVDFSECSAASLRLALLIAAKFRAALSAIHVIPLSAEHSPLSEAVYMPAASPQLNEVENRVVGMLRTAAGRGPLPPYRIIEGHPADGILFAASYEHAGLIMLGTRGRGNTDRLTLGSIAEQVLRRSTVPVLTICPRRFKKRRPGTIRRILVPADSSTEAARAMGAAVAIARKFQAEVRAVRVGKSEVPRGVKVVRDLPPQMDAMLRYIDEENIDLIAIGARRDRWADTTVFGETTERVTRHAPCAVLTVTETE